MKFQTLTEIRKVTQWKDGCVYKTAASSYAFITYHPFRVSPSNENELFCSISIKLLIQIGIKSVRKVSDDTPDIVPVDINSLIPSDRR